MLTEAIEMYLLTIYRLTDDDDRAKTGQIATVLDVGLSSVSEMLNRLEHAGYILREGHKGAVLTAEGRQIALNRLRKHRLLETFLVQLADYKIDEVHDEACRLEHVISDRLADSLERMLGYPQLDPHGHPIPAADGSVTAVSFLPLSEVQVGKTAVIRRVDDNNEEKIRYLCVLGLIPGARVKVTNVAPFHGPMTVSLAGKVTPISNELAQEIGVEIDK